MLSLVFSVGWVCWVVIAAANADGVGGIAPAIIALSFAVQINNAAPTKPEGE